MNTCKLVSGHMHVCNIAECVSCFRPNLLTFFYTHSKGQGCQASINYVKSSTLQRELTFIVNSEIDMRQMLDKIIEY